MDFELDLERLNTETTFVKDDKLNQHHERFEKSVISKVVLIGKDLLEEEYPYMHTQLYIFVLCVCTYLYIHLFVSSIVLLECFDPRLLLFGVIRPLLFLALFTSKENSTVLLFTNSPNTDWKMSDPHGKRPLSI
jgi:hypothetical protein